MILLRSLAFITQNLFLGFTALIGIAFLIGFHELGHFLFAKLFNISVPSFSIGFGPRIFKKKIGETEFTLSALPLGGYVEVAGMAEMGQGEQKSAHTKDARSFAVKPFYQKLLVLFGGIFFNIAFGYFALILLFLLGVPKPVTIIRNVQADSAMEKYLKPADQIIAINGQSVENDVEKLLSLIRPFANQEVQTTINRNNQEHIIPVTLASRKDAEGDLVGSMQGITFEMAKTPSLPFFESINKGIGLTHKFIGDTIKGFLSLGKGKGNLQGPVSIISTIMDGISQSFSVFLLLLALISINLAVLNLIPLPILDGGQILYYTIEAIIGRPIPLKIREYIHIASWLLVLGLVLYLSASEIYKMAKPFIVKLTGKI